MIEVNFDELKSNIADYKDEISKLEEEKVYYLNN